MPLFEVTYKVKHIKVFKVPDEKYIHCVLNEASDVEIISIVKLLEDT